MKITLSANAGVCIQVEQHRIWVDALHSQQQPGFSAVSAEMFSKVLGCEEFKDPNYICVTHCHPDHYDAQMVEAAMERYPEAKLCLPSVDTPKVECEGFCLEFIRLPHEGAQYANVLHYGILITVEGKHILLPGDCETASATLAQAIGEKQIDLAILNFPWVTLSKGRNFLNQILKPKHTLLCHLPFEADDVSGFRASAQRNAQLMDMDIWLLKEPLQTEEVNI